MHTGGLQECSTYKGIYAVSQVTEKGKESFISVCVCVHLCLIAGRTQRQLGREYRLSSWCVPLPHCQQRSAHTGVNTAAGLSSLPVTYTHTYMHKHPHLTKREGLAAQTDGAWALLCKYSVKAYDITPHSRGSNLLPHSVCVCVGVGCKPCACRSREHICAP